MIKNNEILKFDIWHEGFSLGYSEKSWQVFEKPFSIPLNEPVHVRLEVVNDIFQISFNGHPEMTIKANDYEQEPSFWSLIVWNGTEEEKIINFQISDFKILHHN